LRFNREAQVPGKTIATFCYAKPQAYSLTQQAQRGSQQALAIAQQAFVITQQAFVISISRSNAQEIGFASCKNT
jgi:hypothetical protein